MIRQQRQGAAQNKSSNCLGSGQPLHDTALKVLLAVRDLFNTGLKLGGRTLAIYRTSAERNSVRHESGPNVLRNQVARWSVAHLYLDGLASH